MEGFYYETYALIGGHSIFRTSIAKSILASTTRALESALTAVAEEY
jgi:hypothetical protein